MVAIILIPPFEMRALPSNSRRFAGKALEASSLAPLALCCGAALCAVVRFVPLRIITQYAIWVGFYVNAVFFVCEMIIASG